MTSARSFLFAALLACILTAGASTNADAASAGQQRPNILLLISDDQRPDTIAALGNEHIETPSIDRLVREGTAFTRATCAHPLCVPSRAELLTGTTGFTNGVMPPRNDPAKNLPTWAETLRAAGYHTWWVGKWHISGRPSTRGFTDTLGLFSSGRRPDEPQFDYRGQPVTGYTGWMFQTDDKQLIEQHGIGLTPNISGLFADAAIELIGRQPAEPFFLQVNFTAPHDPLLIPPGWENHYRPEDMPLPENFRPRHELDTGNIDGRDEVLFAFPRTEQAMRENLAAYYAVVSHMDQQIGRILAALEETGQANNTIVMFTSDHGLALGSHGLTGKQNMYEHTINVPLIFRGPGIPQGERRAAQCYLRDLYPTTCELAGVSVPSSVEGRSLAGVIRGDDEQVYPFIVGYFRDLQRMIRTDRWKYVAYPQARREQLFDLAHDPLEMRDLSDVAEHAEVERQLRADLVGWLREHDDPIVEQVAALGE